MLRMAFVKNPIPVCVSPAGRALDVTNVSRTGSALHLEHATSLTSVSVAMECLTMDTATEKSSMVKYNGLHFISYTSYHCTYLQIFLYTPGPRFDSFGECSNPCKFDPAIEASLELAPGHRVSSCRWNESGNCTDQIEPCNGTRDWVVQSSGESDPERCIYAPFA